MEVYINSNHGRIGRYDIFDDKVQVWTLKSQDAVDHWIANKGFFATYEEALARYERVKTAINVYYIPKDTKLDLDDLDTVFDYKFKYVSIFPEQKEKYLSDEYFLDSDTLKEYYRDTVFPIAFSYFENFQNEMNTVLDKYAQNGLNSSLNAENDCDCDDCCGCTPNASINAKYRHNKIFLTRTLSLYYN